MKGRKNENATKPKVRSGLRVRLGCFNPADNGCGLRLLWRGHGPILRAESRILFRVGRVNISGGRGIDG